MATFLNFLKVLFLRRYVFLVPAEKPFWAGAYLFFLSKRVLMLNPGERRRFIKWNNKLKEELKGRQRRWVIEKSCKKIKWLENISENRKQDLAMDVTVGMVMAQAGGNSRF